MKEIKQYKCEHCGTIYVDKDKALQCEKNHKFGVDIASVHYLPYASDNTGYPNKILIEFNDGAREEYKR